MIDAVFLSQSDYANSAYWIAKSLETQGLKTASWTERRHIFDYPEGPTLIKRDVLERQLGECTWIVVVQSDLPKCYGGGRRGDSKLRADFIEKWRDKHWVVIHGNSHYRQQPDIYNAIWRDVAEATICYSADLMGLGARNEHLIIPPMDMQYFPTPDRDNGPLRIGHFPARAWQKGTAQIVPLLQKFRGRCEICLPEFSSDDEVIRVPWLKQMQRLRRCDIVIDQIYPEENGKRLGEWVALATEAAASGCISIANSLQPERYVETYGRMPGIHICNDIDSLEAELERLVSLPRSELRKEQDASRAWIEMHHTFEPAGKLLVDRIFH